MEVDSLIDLGGGKTSLHATTDFWWQLLITYRAMATLKIFQPIQPRNDQDGLLSCSSDTVEHY